MEYRRIIKRGPIVFATKEDGSLDPASASSQGLFLADTRFLSTFQLRINGTTPVLLGSSEEILFDAAYLHTNPDLTGIPARSIGLLQHNRITEDAVLIDVTVANWSGNEIDVEISTELGSDFFDSFEARGVKRMKRGETLAPSVENGALRLEYIGLDGVTRITEITSDPPFGRYAENALFFPLHLKVNSRATIELCIRMIQKAGEGVSLSPAPEMTRNPVPDWFDRSTRITTSNAVVNAILARSIEDLEVLMIEFPDAWIPAAGLPRFAVPFGRDSIITGLETLVWNPTISRDALRFLAHRQGKENNPWNYEQPGKIMHEMHFGELARLKEVPFGLFYGSVDSTPLFLVLGGEYIRWTGDLDLYRELKENFDAAWQWIDKYGDIDGSGYIQYTAHTAPAESREALSVGLFNQGWKDHYDAVVYSNGQIVTDHPIALAEVQGEYYRALSVWAEVFDAMPEAEGVRARAAEFRKRAAELRTRFNSEFWMEEKQYYAMALDGHHRQVDSITSNPAECLWTRIIDGEHSDALVRTLMSDAMFTTWGIRTMAATETRYNPFSYHDGSIWPFENGLIASGLKKYGYLMETQEVFEAMVDASNYFEYRRWPEVYCGVSPTAGGVLARQPDASRPQAWSAGLIFLFVQTILGVAARPFSRRVDLTPALPTGISEVTVENVAIAGTTLSLRLVKQGNNVLLEVLDNPGELEIVLHPATPRHHEVKGEHQPAVSH